MTLKTFAQVDVDGNVTCVCQCEAHDRENFEANGVTFVLSPDGVDPIKVLESYKWRKGKWKFVGDKPSRLHRWNKDTGWEFDLQGAWREVKQERSIRLGMTDWTQLPDVPEETRTRYTAYRQALRDITKQPDPTAIVWPEPPSE